MCFPYLEVIRTSTQELVTNVECLRALNAAEEALADHNTPGLVTNVHEDVVATVESTEWYFRAHRRHLEDLLGDEHGLFQLFTRELVSGNSRNNPHGAILAENLGIEIHTLHAIPKSTLGRIEQF